MGFLVHFIFTWWGLLLEALAILHFIRRRPDAWWLFVIIFLGPLGAAIYLFIEAAPDLTSLSQQSARGFSRRKRIRELEALVHVNTAVGNFEELGDLYMDEGRLTQARACFARSIQGGSTTLDPFYKRGACAVLIGDAPAAIPDLERVVAQDPSYDFYRAEGLLAHAFALTGERQGRSPVPRRDPDLDHVRDVSQLRRAAGLRRPHRGGARLGAQAAQQIPGHAGLSAPTRAPPGSARRAGF